MLQILVTLIGSVLAAFGWAFQRRMRGDAVDDAIRRRLNLVKLYRLMKSSGLDSKTLDSLETELTRPISTADAIESTTKRTIPPTDPDVRFP